MGFRSERAVAGLGPSRLNKQKEEKKVFMHLHYIWLVICFEHMEEM